MKPWRWTRRGTISPNVGKSLWLVISLFLGGSIDIPMFISNYFLHSENIAGIDGAASPQVVLADICFLATSRKMPKLATSPHSIILYIYMYIFNRESDKLNLFSMYIYNVYIYIILYIYILKLNYLWGLLYPQKNFPPCPPLAGRPSRSLAPQSATGGRMFYDS